MGALNHIETLNRFSGEEAKCKVLGKNFDYDTLRRFCKRINFEYPSVFKFATDSSDENLMKEVSGFLSRLLK